MSRRCTCLAGGVLAALAVVLAQAPGAFAAQAASPNAYIVTLSGPPAAGYGGGVRGFPATRPRAGHKLDARSTSVKLYRRHLRARHAAVARRVGGVRRFYDYTVALNGFAARMSSSAAARLKRLPGVLSVTKDVLRKAETTTTPAFLGLSQPGGLWSKLGGPGSQGAGKGIVVGVIDSGIWPENPSFAALADPGSLHPFTEPCTTGEQWDAADCSTKILGARFYNAGQGGNAGIDTRFPEEILSARDVNGHGSHTAGTAAGDHDTPFVVNGNALGNGSGMAPNARIAVYKVIWGSGQASGASSDIIAAIDDATADGVDVINYSISGSATSSVDPVELAFFRAAQAGVFVAASAGNTGPGASTVLHNVPWVTTVAAGTHDRVFRATVTLGNGASYTGAGLGAAVPASPLMLAENGGLAGANATGVRLCFSRTWDPGHPEGFLDPAKVAGKIVVCDRGTNDRTDKSKAVQEAGGIGMVLENTSPDSIDSDVHAVSTVHVDNVDGAAIKAYVAGTAHPTASLAAGHAVTGVEAPFVAAFSARGPALAGGGDLLKPDIMAPGVAVLAPVSPVTHGGRDFDFLSGTSMSSPHIAGVAALLKQAHPAWTPMEIKSALMTTAVQRTNQANLIQTDANGVAGPLDYGSGEVNPTPATDPGLAYDSGVADWAAYVCGTGDLAASDPTCQQYGSIDPSDLNTPNIAVGDLVGTQSVTRRVRNVGSSTRYYPSIQAPPGFRVSVGPRPLLIPPGGQATFHVGFRRTTAPFGTYATGSFTLHDGKPNGAGATHFVRSQLVVRPIGLRAAAAVSGSGASGSTPVGLTSGYTGTLTTSVSGLVAANTHMVTLSNPTGAPFPTANPAESDHTKKFTITVPAATTLARVATFDSDVPAGTDTDLYVYKAGTTQLVGSSSGASAEERVDLPSPAAGSYDVYVDLFALAPGVTSQVVPAFDWELGSAAAGNLTATPPSQPVTVGKPASVTAAWSGLTVGQRYLGRLNYTDGADPLGSTLVRVDP